MQGWSHSRYKGVVEEACGDGGIWGKENGSYDEKEKLLVKSLNELIHEEKNVMEKDGVIVVKVGEKEEVKELRSKRSMKEFDWLYSSFFNCSGKLIPMKYTIEVLRFVMIHTYIYIHICTYTYTYIYTYIYIYIYTYIYIYVCVCIIVSLLLYIYIYI
jgi:hypothetical protein